MSTLEALEELLKEQLINFPDQIFYRGSGNRGFSEKNINLGKAMSLILVKGEG